MVNETQKNENITVDEVLDEYENITYILSQEN